MDTNTGKNKVNNNFIVQGSILAIAGVFVRILGLFKRIPLPYIIGDIGNSYYSAAYDIFQLFWIISAYGIPVALSKLVSQKVSKGEYRNADKIFKCTLNFAITIGLASTLIVFFFSNDLASLFREPMSYLAVKVISPTIFMVCILSVFRGYYQGMGTMIPTAISQIIEQIATVFVGLAAAYFLTGYGTKVGLILHNENYKYAYGATGAVLGCVVGAFCATLFLILLYRSNLTRFRKNIYKDPTNKLDSTLSIYKAIFLTIIPVVISSSVTTISNLCDHYLHNLIMDVRGFSALKTVNWGIYTGKYMVLVSVVLALSSAMGAATVPTLSGHVKKKEFDIAASKVSSVIRITMLVAIPAATGLAVLAPSVVYLLFSSTNEVAPTLLRIGGIGIVLFSLSSITSYILQGINHLYTPIKNALIALVVHLLLMTSLLYFTDLKVYSIAISNNVFAFIMCFLNLKAICKYLRYQQETNKTFVFPAISALAMGVSIFVLDLILNKNGYSRIKILFTVFVGVIIYFACMLLSKAIGKEELTKLPGGTRIYSLLKKLRIMK